VPATSVSQTQMAPIPLPGGGSIDWRISFEIPRIDLYKESTPLPSSLTLQPGQFSLQTRLQLCINCVKRKDDHREERGKEDSREKRGKSAGDRERDSLGSVVCTDLRVFAVGHLDSSSTKIRLRVDAVELVDITPDTLESVLECLIRMVLDSALMKIELPIPALRAGAFHLAVTRGPEIADDRIKVFGDV